MDDLEDIPSLSPDAPSEGGTDADAETEAPVPDDSLADNPPSLAAAVTAHRSIFRPAPRRRFFGIPLVGSISLVTSICAHAAVIGIGFAVYRHFRPPPPPVLTFALGDASQSRNEIFWKEQTPGGTGMPQLSEIDPSQVPPNSSAAVMQQRTANHDADVPTNRLASTYVGPRAVWADAPLVGAQDNAAQPGTPAMHRVSAPGSATANPPPPAQLTQGNGKGNAVGAGNANSSTGRAGVRSGLPDIDGLPKPIYPDESYRRREEGTVMLSVSVKADGSVGDVTVVSSPPFPRLTRSAIDAARKVHFDREYAGRALQIPYVFKLPS